MGTGKTTIGKILASQLGWDFVDTDELIVAQAGKPISEIFATEGETAFRDLETAVCKDIINWRRRVVATGGGIILRPENRQALLQAGMVICLEAPAEEIVQRLMFNTDRPLLQGDDPAQRIRQLLADRAAAYAALPHHIDTYAVTPSDVANSIIRVWRSKRRRAYQSRS
jgi:shikimate kinase